MITYVQKEMTVDTPITVTCDRCHNTYEWGSLESAEFLHIRHEGGYNSTFGDGNIVICDICQYCLAELLGEYLHEEVISGITV